MQAGHYVALVGIMMMVSGGNVSGLGFLLFFVGCFMCDPNKRTRR